MDVKEIKPSKYELVAPEGGWGYMIGIGVILNLATLSAFVSCFGVLYKDLIYKVNMDSTSITIFYGVNALCCAISGFITSPLLKVMSIRQLGYVAAFLFNLGTFGMVFVNTKALFFISQGFVQGIGNGILFNLSCTVLNNYFVKRRLLAFSFTQTIVAAFCLITPQLVEWSIETYGYQGARLLLSALSLHNIIGIALMQPVEWHMKKVEVLEPDEKEIGVLPMDNNKCIINAKNMSTLNGLDKSEYTFDLTNDKYVINKDEKVMDLKNRIKDFFSKFIDLSLIKSFFLSHSCIGIAFCSFSDLTFTVMLPQALYSMVWSESEVAKALSMYALGDFLTRILFIFASGVMLKFGSHKIYIVGLVIAFFSRIGMLWSQSKPAIITFISIMGISRCVVTMLVPVVVGDVVDQDKFTSAMGMVLISFGLTNWTVGPLIGFIRDLTDSYSTTFYILTSFFGIAAITWSIELLYKKKKKNNM